MPSVHQAGNPAAGAVVLGMPRPKVYGLSEMQRRVARQHTMVGRVLGAGPKGGPIGLGNASAVRFLNLNGPIRNTRGALKSGYKRRSPKPRVQNRVFCQCPKSAAMLRAEQASKLEARRQGYISRLVDLARRAIRKHHLSRIAQLESRLRAIAPERLAQLEQYARTCRRPRNVLPTPTRQQETNA